MNYSNRNKKIKNMKKKISSGMNRKINFILIFVFYLSSLGFGAQTVFSWDDKTTHPALTNEAINFYNINFERSITDKQKEWIIEGAIDEDTPPRWMHHFYDPVYNEGLFGDRGLNTAKQWATSQGLQMNTHMPKGNKAWKKAIYEYVKGNEKDAFYTLGFTLHLLEDMAVPEHTRNDPHPGDSPLENFSKQFNIENFKIADSLNSYEPASLESIEEYFDYLANYSNNYFLSKDTANGEGYERYNKPEIIDGDEYGFGVDKDGSYFKLARTKEVWDKDGEKKLAEYELEDDNEDYKPILQGYWNRLSREAVISVAGAINLFFQEVEKARNDESLLEKPPVPKTALITIAEDFLPGSGSRFWGAIKNVGNKIKDVFDKEKKDQTNDLINEVGLPEGSTTSKLNFQDKDSTFEKDEKQANQRATQKQEKEYTAVSAVFAVVETMADTKDNNLISEVEPRYRGSTSIVVATKSVSSPNNPQEAPVIEDDSISEVELPEEDSTSEVATTTPETASTTPETPEEVFAEHSILINEIAWAGTDNSAYDEWIELFNNTENGIDLDGWVLFSETDNGPYINLSGTLGSGEYYLIERTDDTSVPDVEADYIGSFGNGLSNSGERLVLVQATSTATTTIDSTPEGAWPAGDTDKYTMERYDTENWYTNNDFLGNKGTPKFANSVNSILTINKNIDRNLTIRRLNNPVLVDNINAVVESGVLLTVEPGVEIKFNGDSGFNILGKILAQGTESEPIAFTSAQENPNPGDWFGICINENAENGSIFEYTNFSYGGKYYNNSFDKSLLVSWGPEISVSNSSFKYSKVYGLRLKNSNSQIANSVFEGNEADGVYTENGEPTINNNTFLENLRGLYLSNSNTIANNNTFTSNSGGAIYSSGELGSFSGNSGSNNNPNSINIWGNLTNTNSTKTLKSNDIPYYLNGYETPTVVESSQLTIENGVVIKGGEKTLNVNGNFVIDGQNPSDIIFTSIYDDEISGDSNNDETSTMPQAGQFAGINISETGSLVASGFTMKYAGSVMSGGRDKAGILLEGSTAQIANALFKNNYPHGIRAVNSENVSIENARFEEHNYSGPWGTKAAVVVENSTTSLSNVTFENNLLGVLGDGLSAITATLIEWIENTATTSPEGLF